MMIPVSGERTNVKYSHVATYECGNGFIHAAKAQGQKTFCGLSCVSGKDKSIKTINCNSCTIVINFLQRNDINPSICEGINRISESIFSWYNHKKIDDVVKEMARLLE